MLIQRLIVNYLSEIPGTFVNWSNDIQFKRML